jgi:hypothetical protein
VKNDLLSVGFDHTPAMAEMIKRHRERVLTGLPPCLPGTCAICAKMRKKDNDD